MFFRQNDFYYEESLLTLDIKPGTARMSSNDLQIALFRPAVLTILRAAGFNHTRNAVLDTVTDLAARYLLLLASSTAQHAVNNHHDYQPTIQDVRMALADVGALRPQLSALEEKAKGSQRVDGETVPFEDMRGVQDFVGWARGPVNREIRRIAGLSHGPGEVNDNMIEDENLDYVTGRCPFISLSLWIDLLSNLM